MYQSLNAGVSRVWWIQRKSYLVTRYYFIFSVFTIWSCAGSHILFRYWFHFMHVKNIFFAFFFLHGCISNKHFKQICSWKQFVLIQLNIILQNCTTVAQHDVNYRQIRYVLLSTNNPSYRWRWWLLILNNLWNDKISISTQFNSLKS